MKAKAAATRHLAQFAQSLALEHDSGSPHDRQRVGVAQCLVECYRIIAAEGMFLGEVAKRALPINWCELVHAVQQFIL